MIQKRLSDSAFISHMNSIEQQVKMLSMHQKSTNILKIILQKNSRKTFQQVNNSEKDPSKLSR